jgi:hypothetical protein
MDLAAPVSRWRARLDGHLMSSRRIGNRLFLVLRHVPTVATFVHSSFLTRLPNNQPLLAQTPLSTFVPKVRVNGCATHRRRAARAIPSPAAGFAQTGDRHDGWCSRSTWRRRAS